jgi:hypothetical protein
VNRQICKLNGKEQEFLSRGHGRLICFELDRGHQGGCVVGQLLRRIILRLYKIEHQQCENAFANLERSLVHRQQNCGTVSLGQSIHRWLIAPTARWPKNPSAPFPSSPCAAKQHPDISSAIQHLFRGGHLSLGTDPDKVIGMTIQWRRRSLPRVLCWAILCSEVVHAFLIGVPCLVPFSSVPKSNMGKGFCHEWF